MKNVVRIMQKEDVSEAAEMEKQIFSSPWSRKSFLDALSSDDTIYLVCVSEKRITGYCGIWVSFDTADLCNFAVAPEYRRQGIAWELLQEGLGLAKERGVKQILLEVRKSNKAAICLYQKAGFEQIGVRKGYYSAPKEDAVIMRLWLSH